MAIIKTPEDNMLKILFIHINENDKYLEALKKVEKIIVDDTSIKHENIDYLCVENIDNYTLADDDVIHMAIVPESIAFKDVNRKKVEQVFPLLENVSLKDVLYYTSNGNLYSFTANVDTILTLLEAQETLEDLNIINDKGEIINSHIKEKLEEEMSQHDRNEAE